MPAECPRAQMLHVLTRVLDLHLRVWARDPVAIADVGELAKLLGAPGPAHEQEHRPAAELHAEDKARAPEGDQAGDGHGISKCASAYALA